jgi:vacuolar-type H+-ATPase subunit H
LGALDGLSAAAVGSSSAVPFLRAGAQGASTIRRVSDEAPGNQHGPAHGAAQAADRVGAIVAAAEESARRMVAQTEERMRERIAEGDRAAENRVRAAEEEAEDILREARDEASRLVQSAQTEGSKAVSDATSEALTIVARAQENADQVLKDARDEAAKSVAEAEERARDLLRDARSTASDLHTEGLEIVSNLRQMGDSLRSNAERLLRDVQMIHSRMVAELDRADGGLGALSGYRASRAPDRPARGSDGAPRDRLPREPIEGGEVLDVPEFIPPG